MQHGAHIRGALIVSGRSRRLPAHVTGVRAGHFLGGSVPPPPSPLLAAAPICPPACRATAHSCVRARCGACMHRHSPCMARGLTPARHGPRGGGGCGSIDHPQHRCSKQRQHSAVTHGRTHLADRRHTGSYQAEGGIGPQKESKRSTSPRIAFGTATRDQQSKVGFFFFCARRRRVSTARRARPALNR